MLVWSHQAEEGRKGMRDVVWCSKDVERRKRPAGVGTRTAFSNNYLRENLANLKAVVPVPSRGCCGLKGSERKSRAKNREI